MGQKRMTKGISNGMISKVAVAIPTYNRVEYLKECVQSVLDQTFQDFSIFVFDNASSEPVEKELQDFGDKRIQFIGSKKNTGSTGNINRILQYPFESEYVIIFHDDDAMHPKKLELQTSFLDAHKDMVFVASDFNRVSGKAIHSFPDFKEDKVKSIVYKNDYEFVKAEMSWLRCAFDSVMYRGEAVRGARIQPERFSDFADMAFLVEISKKGPCAFIRAPLVNYRIHAGQDSKLWKEEYEEGALELLSFFRESFPKVLEKRDEKLFRTYSVNFLIRSYAHMSKGFFDFLRFLKKCRQRHMIGYGSFRYIDMRGIVSLVSIIFHNKKIIDAAIWSKNLFRS